MNVIVTNWNIGFVTDILPWGNVYEKIVMVFFIFDFELCARIFSVRNYTAYPFL